MTSEDPLERLLGDNEQLAKMLDDFSRDTSTQQSEAQPTNRQYDIVFEFYQDPESNRITSIFFESKYSDKINDIIPRRPARKRDGFRTTTPLDEFIGEYIRELEHRYVRHDTEEKMFGVTLADGILYKQAYHDNSRKMGKEVRREYSII